MSNKPADKAVPTSQDQLGGLARTTQRTYERNAERYARERSQAFFERGWIDRALGMITPGGHVLDVGCGAGRPIAAHICDSGYRVTGIDFSREMLRLVSEAFPTGDWRYGDMRTLDLPERFDGIIAWDSFFHLTRDEQRSTLKLFAAHLRPGGVLLVTVGPDDGEAIGQVGDDAVYHASLAPEAYGAVCDEAGLNVIAHVPEDPACDGHSVLLAVKPAS